MKMNKIVLIALMVFVLPAAASGGKLEAPAAPDNSGSAMSTLEDIYNRIDTGAAAPKRTGPFREPTSGPASTDHSLNDLMSLIKTKGLAPDAAEAIAKPGDVVGSKFFWCLHPYYWGVQEGTLPGEGLSDSSTLMPYGYYAQKTLEDVDPDLNLDNIRAGVVIFGIPGNPQVVDTSSGDARPASIKPGKTAYVDGQLITGTAPSDGDEHAPVAVSGQTIACQEGDDGDWQKGMTAPIPRFTDNSDGTVTDNLTQLVWVRDLSNSCFSTPQTWADAVAYVRNNVKNGQCGLADGSAAGDWRLPNVWELQSLVNLAYLFPALSDRQGTAQATPGNPFWGDWSDFYWTSTSVGDTWAVDINLGDGQVSTNHKSIAERSWPVRDK